jgi:iron complex outermembrane recepter protein
VTHRKFWRYSPWGPIEVTIGLVGNNLLDVDIRNHVQFHKDEVLQPGRSFKFFLTARYGDMPAEAPGYDKAPRGRAPQPH